MTDEQMAEVARALAHPARVRIVRLMAEQTECRGADVFSELPLAQSTVSEHVRILKQAGLVTSRPVGSGTVYCLDRQALDGLAGAITSMAAKVPTCAGTEGC